MNIGILHDSATAGVTYEEFVVPPDTTVTPFLVNGFQLGSTRGIKLVIPGDVGSLDIHSVKYGIVPNTSNSWTNITQYGYSWLPTVGSPGLTLPTTFYVDVSIISVFYKWQILGTYSTAGGLVNFRIIIVQDGVGNAEPTLTASISGNEGFADNLFTLTSSATDAEDGDISASVVWSSDLDGILGNGTLSTFLTEGTHTLTASITDSGTATITQTFPGVVVHPIAINPDSVGMNIEDMQVVHQTSSLNSLDTQEISGTFKLLSMGNFGNKIKTILHTSNIGLNLVDPSKILSSEEWYPSFSTLTTLPNIHFSYKYSSQIVNPIINLKDDVPYKLTFQILKRTFSEVGIDINGNMTYVDDADPNITMSFNTVSGKWELHDSSKAPTLQSELDEPNSYNPASRVSSDLINPGLDSTKTWTKEDRTLFPWYGINLPDLQDNGGNPGSIGFMQSDVEYIYKDGIIEAGVKNDSEQVMFIAGRANSYTITTQSSTRSYISTLGTSVYDEYVWKPYSTVAVNLKTYIRGVDGPIVYTSNDGLTMVYSEQEGGWVIRVPGSKSLYISSGSSATDNPMALSFSRALDEFGTPIPFPSSFSSGVFDSSALVSGGNITQEFTIPVFDRTPPVISTIFARSQSGLTLDVTLLR